MCYVLTPDTEMAKYRQAMVQNGVLESGSIMGYKRRRSKDNDLISLKVSETREVKHGSHAYSTQG